MTESTACLWRKCRHLAVMHKDRTGSCTWPYCECRQLTAPTGKTTR